MALTPVSPAEYDPSYAYDAAPSSSLSAGLGPPVADRTPQQTSPVGFDTASGQMWVNGETFDSYDHRSALETRKALDKPMQPMPGNYRPVSVEEYGNYIKNIEDPGLGRMLKKNFGIGVDNYQLLVGRGLQFLGADELGTAIVDQQIQDLGYNEPYQLAFTEIKSAGDAGMWFAANLAQQGPNLIESVLSALAGAAIGGVSAGPLGAVLGGFGGLIAKFGGKEVFKKAVVNAAQKKIKGEALDESEEAMLSGLAAARLSQIAKGTKAEVVGGAAAASYASNYGMGVADIYGEQVEAGTEDRGTALALATIYAAAESLPEFIGLGYLTKGAKTGWKGNKLRRGGQAAAATVAGGAGEGATEAAQEGLLISQNPNLTPEEARLRLINAFFAGAGVGGTLSGGASVLRRGPRKIDPTGNEATELATPDGPGPTIPEGQAQGELFPDLIGSYEDDGRATQEELIAERDSLLEERDRLMRAQGGIYEEAADMMNRETSLADASVEEVVQMMAQQEGRFGEIDRILDQIDPALAQIDRQLADPRFSGLPGRAAALAERMGSQPTLFDVGPSISELPADRQVDLLNRQIEQGATRGQFPSTPDSQTGQLTFGYGDEQQTAIPPGAVTQQDVETQDFLNTQAAPANTAMADAMQRAQEAQAQQQLAQQQAEVAARQQAQQRQDDLFGPAEMQLQERQFQQAGAAPAAQMQFPASFMGPDPVVFGGEPTISLPFQVRETGQVVYQPVPVRQALEENKQRIEALEALQKCLRGGK